MSKSLDNKAQHGSSRKVYKTPTLKTFGNVHQITRASDGPKTDNGKPVAHKTGLIQP